jgi:hypothetical protein
VYKTRQDKRTTTRLTRLTHHHHKPTQPVVVGSRPSEHPCPGLQAQVGSRIITNPEAALLLSQEAALLLKPEAALLLN